MTDTCSRSGTNPPAVRTTSGEHDSLSEDVPASAGRQHDHVSALVGSLRADRPLNPDEIGFGNVRWGPATNIPVRADDRRRLATIGAIVALNARLRGQIAKTTPLTSPAATYWAIDDHVTLHAHAEICVDADSGRVKGAAVTIDPASLDLSGTAIHALTQRQPTHRYDLPWPRPASGPQGGGATDWSTPNTTRSTP